jgi:hypothetical protein
MKLYVFILILFFFLPKYLAYSVTEADFEETTLGLTPKIWVNLPNGVVEIMASEKVSQTDTIFKIKYDFFQNNINSRFDFNLWFKTSFFGIEVGDRIDFEQIISNKKYTIRNRYIMPHYDYLLSRNFRIKVSWKFEDRYFASIGDEFYIRKGNDIRHGLGLIYDSLIDTPDITKGMRNSFELTGPASYLGSDYDYIQAEFESVKVWKITSKNKLKFNLRAGYPVTNIRRPPDPIYYLGGYGYLKGYNYNEFMGNCMIYGSLAYKIPFKRKLREKILYNSLEINLGDICFEFGNAGDEKIFTNLADLKTSVYIGSECSLVLFRRFNMKFRLIIAQALAPNRSLKPADFTITSLAMIFEE